VSCRTGGWREDPADEEESTTGTRLGRFDVESELAAKRRPKVEESARSGDLRRAPAAPVAERPLGWSPIERPSLNRRLYFFSLPNRGLARRPG